MTGLILAIDQGTTNTKAILVDASGGIVARAAVPMSVDYPQPGWAEQSALDIWESVRTVIAEVVAQSPAAISALAISNQRETIVIWDRQTHQPIGPAITWQCRRSTDRCAALRDAGAEAEIVDRTGVGLDPLFPAAKLAWLLDAVPGARERARRGELAAGTIDSWLLWRLTAGAAHATDHSNASRTQLFNTLTLAWDPELLRLFDVPQAMLPSVRPSAGRFGEVAAGACALPAGTPIEAMLGDSHAALYGHGIRVPGVVKATYGTGSSLMTLTNGRPRSSNGLSGTIAWSSAAGVAYALEGNIPVSGQAAAFMAEMLGIQGASELADLAASVADANGVSFVPALVGLGAPRWLDDVRGVVTGLSLGTKRAHLARAAIEAIAFQVRDVFVAMEMDLGSSLAGLSVDGGASRNDLLMQLQADILDRPVSRGEVAELSAIGAARLAATALGHPDWPDHAAGTIFSPRMEPVGRALALERWSRAVRQAICP
jgi:glycerol kinase